MGDVSGSGHTPPAQKLKLSTIDLENVDDEGEVLVIAEDDPPGGENGAGLPQRRP